MQITFWVFKCLVEWSTWRQHNIHISYVTWNNVWRLIIYIHSIHTLYLLFAYNNLLPLWCRVRSHQNLYYIQLQHFPVAYLSSISTHFYPHFPSFPLCSPLHPTPNFYLSHEWIYSVFPHMLHLKERIKKVHNIQWIYFILWLKYLNI